MNKLALISTSLLFASLNANANLSIPGASIPSGYDRVYSSTGTSCESSQEPDMYVQVGAVASQDDKYGSNSSNNYNGNYDRDEFGGYVQVVIPISDGRKRVDCSKLYALELQKLEAEILKLKLESEMLGWEATPFDNETFSTNR